jgi:predicted PurR-regulated permease PerM
MSTADDGAEPSRPVPEQALEPGPEPPPIAWPSAGYWVRTTLVVVATLLVVLAATRITHVLLVVVVAFVLAVGMDPAVRLLGRARIPRGWAVAILFVVLAGFIALFIALLVPPLVREVRQFADSLPGYLTDLQRRDDWIGNATRHADISAKVQDFIADLPRRIGASFNTVIGVAGTVLGTVFDVLTVSILTLYFALALPRLRQTAAALTAPRHRAQVDRVIQRSLEKIGGYVSGNLITSAVCTICAMIAFIALRLDYAVPLALWTGVADLVPQVGAYLGAAPVVLVALAKGPAYGIAAIIYFIVYQQFENYILAPRVYRGSIDLSPAAVIISTLIGGTLAGFAGALLALPVAATIKVIAVDVVLANRLDRTTDDP